MMTLSALAKLDQAAAIAKGVTQIRGYLRVGRPSSLDETAQAKVRAGLAAGEEVTDLARRFDIYRQTIMRIRNTNA